MKTLTYAYSRARSAGFFAEFMVLETLTRLFPGEKKLREARTALPDVKTLQSIRADLLELLKQDAQNISHGEYPLSVLMPESPIQHLKRLPLLFWDSFSIYLRRRKGKTQDFDREAEEFLADLPPYYRRNFHYQSNGYLSRRSAEVYEHQVELLFKGSADAMRRLIIPPLRKKFATSPDGEGLRFLEIAAGTGRATRFVHQAFPKAKITALDLSDPYLKVAQENLSRFPRVDFIQGNAAQLPFRDQQFDAVYSVFLFHELPMEERQQIIKESRRVLKDDGLLGMVDSIQEGDKELFTPLLKNFPKDFHEPFYRNYIAHPMEELFKQAGFKNVAKDTGFTSKVVTGLH
ncbi:unnamed protein product [Sphagnum jensenii]|uniref:Methyltransferase domain-containing protein n=1 Tax=Sphagnum jensenii TaxID=128206 RepID=A0ABP0V6T8_9BRYO